MRVLVTGGSGFIGSHVLDRLLAAGIEPINYDLRPSPHHSPADVKTVIGDVLDAERLARATRGCDAVIHLAAAADVGVVAREPVPAEAINARGTLNVLEAARAAGVDRVLYGSTIWVYGNGNGHRTDEEDSLPLPNHLYTATKLAGEMYCRSYHELYGLEYTVLRFGIPFGPRARSAAVIPTFVSKAMAGEPLTVAGDGSQGRRFVYVEDLADGIVRGLAPEAANRTFNLAGRETVTVRELVDTVRELVGDPGVIHTPARTADFSGVEVSSQRAASELGWSASTSFQEGLRRYVDWHRAQAGEENGKVAASVTASDGVASAVPAAAPGPAKRARRPVGYRRLALASLLACLTGVLTAYFTALRSTHFETDQAHTVGMTSLLVLLLYANLSSEWRTTDWRASGAGLRVIVCWMLVSAYAIALIWPRMRDVFNLAPPDPAVLMLSFAGAALGIFLTTSGLRLMRTWMARGAPDQA